MKDRVAAGLDGPSPAWGAASAAWVGTVACGAPPAAPRGWRQPLATTTPPSPSQGKQRPTRVVVPPPAEHRRRGGPRQARDVLVAPHRLGRPSGAQHRRGRPQTAQAVQRGAAHHRGGVAQPTPARRPAAVLVVSPQRPAACAVTPVRVAQWRAGGHRRGRRGHDHGVGDGPLGRPAGAGLAPSQAHVYGGAWLSVAPAQPVGEKKAPALTLAPVRRL